MPILLGTGDGLLELSPRKMQHDAPGMSRSKFPPPRPLFANHIDDPDDWSGWNGKRRSAA
jgi:hypothetical protein